MALQVDLFSVGKSLNGQASNIMDILSPNNKNCISPPMSERDSWLHQSIFSVQTTVVNIVR